jgi:hypothetical protein
VVKSTVDEVRQRFDADVERFLKPETGQSATLARRPAPRGGARHGDETG